VGENDVFDICEGVASVGHAGLELAAGLLASHPRVDENRRFAVEKVGGDVTRRPVDIDFDSVDVGTRCRLFG
jgi:hypothetical protein